ncbi:MAG: hypothetical protein WCL04_07200 [Verrucomicrobiota bacterium]
MEDPAPTENPPADFNKIDLTQLQSFSFGTQWAQDKAVPGGTRPPREGRREDRPFRPREGGGMGEPRRDRREFRRPAGAGEGAAAPGGPAAAPRHDGGSRPPRGEEPRGNFRGPRREDDDRRGGGFREDGPRRFGNRGPMLERGPYLSPFFNVTFYPEDTSFATLVKTIRTSLRTFELFEVARAVVGKSDRCIALIERAPAGGPEAPASDAPPAKPAPLAISVQDALPFENEEAAIAHVMATHLATFFDTTEIEVEPPKGNFQVVNKCGITGELLAPPNYHRYGPIMRQHHATRLRMPFEAFAAKIETVRDPEAVNQWLEKMKKTVRYTWKLAGESETPPSFATLEEARQHLLASAREKVVRLADNWRVPGKNLALLPAGEIRRAAEGALERQRHFPLDTANALRGRLRREGLSIFKKGSKGITYVCAVRRKLRTSDQVFAENLGALIAFIEAHPMVRRSVLPEKFLGFKLPVAAQPAAETPKPQTTSPAAVVAEGTAPADGDTPAAAATATTVPPAAPETASGSATPFAATLTPEKRERLTKLHSDLRWLLSEGYVMEFMDGRLFIPPPVAAARKQEAETTEHDLENFPDAPAGEPAAGEEPGVSADAAVPASTEPEGVVPATLPESSATEPVVPPADPAAAETPPA